MFRVAGVQGQGVVMSVAAPACSVDPSSPLAGTVSDGLTGPPLLTFTPSWSASGPPNLSGSLTSVQTATLAPGGYVVQIGLASGGGALAMGLLEIVAAPNGVPAYDVLADPAMVLMLNPELASDPAKVAALPMMLRKATETIRRYCNRMFTRRTYTEYLTPSIEGVAMLYEMPVNSVIRASRSPRTAITITADPSVYQVAFSDYASIDSPIPTPFNVTYTGLNLNGASYGSFSKYTIPFAGLATIDDLAAAVNAISGWKATVDAAGYGRWPVSELWNDGNSQGALVDGVQLKVFSEDVSTSRINLMTGEFRTNRTYGGMGPRWGPNFAIWDDDAGECDVVRVSYDAGLTTIPMVVQEAAVELAKTAFDRISLDYAIKKESIGDYSYELNDRISLSIPDPIRQDLSPHIIHRA